MIFGHVWLFMSTTEADRETSPRLKQARAGSGAHAGSGRPNSIDNPIDTDHGPERPTKK